VDVFPAHPAELGAAAVALASAIAGDAVAGPLEAAELFDVEMDQLAGVVALVATHRRSGVQIAQAAEPGTPQDPAYRGRRDADIAGDLLAGDALPAQLDDPLLGRLRGRLP